MFKPDILNTKRGVILLSVIMVTIVISIVLIGIMSVNVSQIKTSQSIIDSIKAEELALGISYLCHQALNEGNPDCPTVTTMPVLDGKTFNIKTASATAAPGGGTYNTDIVTVEIEYPAP